MHFYDAIKLNNMKCLEMVQTATPCNVWLTGVLNNTETRTFWQTRTSALNALHSLLVIKMIKALSLMPHNRPPLP